MVEYYVKGKKYAPGTILKWQNGTKIEIQPNGSHKIVSTKTIISRDNKTTNKHSVNGIVKLKIKKVANKAINCPTIAIHLILIRFANKTVLTD